MTKKEEVLNPVLSMDVFHKSIYKGKEPMKVVGIRETEVELFGDYSGGVSKIREKDWLPIKGLFRLRKICEQHEKFGSCTLHNLHCGYPDCEPYTNEIE